ncbi:MAG: hypothetical protein LBR50_09940 [Tannerella sp.]|jgi:hypothetical protein|nr:hypothetical protein [Tannerella sp.]
MTERFKLIIAVVLLLSQTITAQRVGEWTLYPATYDTKQVAEAPNRVYALADGTLYSYGKDDNSVTVHTKQNGMSDSDISLIDYHSGTKTLVIVYGNGNIDLLSENGIYNLPFLKNTTNIPDKTINNISFDNETAYISTAFGVMAVSLAKKEISETYKLDCAAYDCCVKDGTIYAATDNDILTGSLSDNLLDIHNWKEMPLQTEEFDAAKVRNICVFQNVICLRVDGVGVYYIDSGSSVKSLLKQSGLQKMKMQTDRLIINSSSTMYVFSSLSARETVNLGTVNGVSSLKNDGTYWIAGGLNGLTGIRQISSGKYETTVTELNPAGPKRNLAAFMTMHGDKLLVAGGGRWTDRFWNAGTLMTYENGEWTNLDEDAVNKQVGYTCRDYTGVAVDPNDETHLFISTYGEGLLEINDYQYVQLYNHTNSPIQSAIAGNKNYNRIGSVTFDSNGNLWMTNCEVENGIVVRTADGNWQALKYSGAGTSAYLVDKILITKKGHKWVNVARSKDRSGILVFDDRETPTDNSDDVSNFFTSFKSGTGTAIEASVYYCITEDLNGEIWIGTDKGPIYCTSPANAIDKPDNLYCNRIVRTNDDGENYYFLNGEQINAIAVDGGNRKWIGTTGSGIFLVSADGMETIHQFTTDNSPLYSNNIQSIAVNQRTGEVFIGTDKGLISYTSEATEPSESYSDVYAYPNPVRPDYDGQVIITGLMNNSNVKITDLNGNLLYQGKSAGGQMAWNCRNSRGNRVATGIYLVIAATPNARESVVARIAVVR